MQLSDHLITANAADPKGPAMDILIAYSELARMIETSYKPSAERTTSIRKLVESHDCFMRVMKEND